MLLVDTLGELATLYASADVAFVGGSLVAVGGHNLLEPAALELHGLRKAFGAKVAVDNLDLQVGAGSFFGIVGPNGAGKTTALSMAVGLLHPDAGRSTVLGVDVWADPDSAKQLLGVLPDGLALPQ